MVSILPDLGFTKKDKIFLAVAALVMFSASFSFSAYVWVKTREIEKLLQTTPQSKPFGQASISSPIRSAPTTLDLPLQNSPFPQSNQLPSIPPTYISILSGHSYNWQTFKSEKYGFSFKHPEWLVVRSYTSPAWQLPIEEDSAWALHNTGGNLLAEITISNLTLQDVQDQYPDWEFENYNSRAVTVYRFRSGFQTVLYLLVQQNRNVWVKCDLHSWPVGAELALETMEEIIQSMML